MQQDLKGTGNTAAVTPATNCIFFVLSAAAAIQTHVK